MPLFLSPSCLSPFLFPLLPAVTQCRLSANLPKLKNTAQSSISLTDWHIQQNSHTKNNFHRCQPGQDESAAPCGPSNRPKFQWFRPASCCDYRLHNGPALHNVCGGCQSVISLLHIWRNSAAAIKGCLLWEQHPLIESQLVHTSDIADRNECIYLQLVKPTTYSACYLRCVWHVLRTVWTGNHKISTSANSMCYISPACYGTIPTLDVSVSACCAAMSHLGGYIWTELSMSLMPDS